MKKLIFLAIGLTLVFGVFFWSKPQKPNILLICIDDLNSWTSCLKGHPQIHTPYIDKLASKGVLFHRAYSNGTLCNPSRSSLFTGIHPHSSSLYDNSIPFRKTIKLRQRKTLTQRYIQEGYEVIGTGKVYHGKLRPKLFNQYWPSMNKKSPKDPTPQNLPLSSLKHANKTFDWGRTDIPLNEFSDIKIANWVAQTLKKDHSKPFFLACGLKTLHLPWHYPNKPLGGYSLKDIQLPQIGNPNIYTSDLKKGSKHKKTLDDHEAITQSNEWNHAVLSYLECIRVVDHAVGIIMKALEQSPHAENTIVVLWSDHGMHLGEKKAWRKKTLWKESSHIPLIIAGPKIKPGNSQQVVSLLDLYPTLLELTEFEKDPECEGQSLVPLLQNPEALDHRMILTSNGPNDYALRSNQWTYIKHYNNKEELYDANSDPFEHQNLVLEKDHIESLNKMRKNSLDLLNFYRPQIIR